MDTFEYNSLDSQQFDEFKSIPDQKKSNLRIWGFIAVISIAALAGYLIGTAKGKFNLRNPVVRKNPKTKNFKSDSSQSITT